MEVDLKGRVQNLRLGTRRVLVPLFEAISNSMHATANVPNARIDVKLERMKFDSGLFNDDSPAPVHSVHITDNGIGFTDENLDSFARSDSTYKAKIGGKGVGRLTWLKVFQSARVDSTYQEPGGAWARRQFTFSIENDGVGDASVTASDTERSTTVSLLRLRNRFAASFPTSVAAVSQRIVEHFYQRMFIANCPRIFVGDERQTTDVSRLFRVEYAEHSSRETLAIGSSTLDLIHVRNYRAGQERGHYVHLCANHRTVTREKVSTLLTTMPEGRMPDQDAEGAFWYSALVSGDPLDRAVTAERDCLEFPDDSQIAFDGDVSRNELETVIAKAVAAYLDPQISELRVRQSEQIVRYVNNERPEYRYLIRNRSEQIAEIPLSVSSDRDIERELHRLNYEADRDLRERGESLARQTVASVEDMREWREEYLRFFAEENEFGKSSLARYVVHRRAVLELLRKFMNLTDDGKQHLEEVVHRVICPLRITSDDPEFGKHNLWVIDDRLAFHQYFASDKSMRAMEPLDSTSQRRPDIIVFDHPHGFREADGADVVTILEFKRPERTDYPEGENPITQVYNYVRDIREGKAKDAHGATIQGSDRTQFYAYIVATLTPRLRVHAVNSHLTHTPDRLGFFGFNPTLNAYIEVLDYTKVLGDATKRNAVLFKHLGLST